MRSLKAKVSTADTLIKVPGKGQQYGRGIYKLIENSADNYPEVNAAIQRIKTKGIELSTKFVTADRFLEFINECWVDDFSLDLDESIENQLRKGKKPVFSEVTKKVLNEIGVEAKKSETTKLDTGNLKENEVSISQENDTTMSMNNSTISERRKIKFNVSIAKNKLKRVNKINKNELVLEKFFKVVNSKFYFCHLINDSERARHLEDAVLLLKKFSDVEKILKSSNDKEFVFKIKAKLYNYALNTSLFSFVQVFCRQCEYNNILPFHLLYALNPTEALSTFQNSLAFIRQSKAEKYITKSFSFRWALETQPVTVICENSIRAFYYECPRCKMDKMCSNLLEYIYRIPFTLSDNDDKKLNPCIFEDQLGLKLMNNIDPVYYIFSEKHQKLASDFVYKIIDEKYMFTMKNQQIVYIDKGQRETKTIYRVLNFTQI